MCYVWSFCAFYTYNTSNLFRFEATELFGFIFLIKLYKVNFTGELQTKSNNIYLK